MSAGTKRVAVPRTDRIVAVDIARSVAMVLALSAHAVSRLDVDVPLIVALAFHNSAPVFMLLFGAMTTIVHIPRRERSGLTASSVACWSRGLQCYLFFAMNAVAIGVTQGFSVAYIALCLLLLGSSSLVPILVYYTIMFAALPAIIELIRKIGYRALLLAAFCYHLLYPLLKSLPDLPLFGDQPILSRVNGLLVGAGMTEIVVGPSILHSLVLVFAGCWLGDWMRQERGGAKSLRPLLPLLGLFVLLIVYSLIVPGPGIVSAEGLANNHLRNLDHPAYVGIYGFVAIAAIALLYRWSAYFQRIPSALLFLSRRSLFAFGFGNLVIALWPASWQGVIGAPASCSLLVASAVLVVFVYDVLMNSDAAHNRVAQFAQDVSGHVNSGLASLAAQIWKLASGAKPRLSA